MVEKDSWTSIHIVAFSIVLCYPMSIKLSNSIWASWIERCILCLRYSLHLTEHLWCWCLVESTLWLYDSYSFKHVSNTNSINISCCTWCIPWCCNKWLCCKIIYFICLWYLHCWYKWYYILHICVDKVNLILDMIYVSIIYDTLSSHDAVYIVALF